MFENLPNTSATPAAEPTPDYERGLFLSSKVGHEFNAISRSGILAQMVLSQGFAVLFIIPIVLFYCVRNLLGGPFYLAITIAGIAGVAIITGGIIAMVRIGGNGNAGLGIKGSTDSRYRIRASIPKRRQNPGFRQWAEVTLNVKPKEPEEIEHLDADDLEAERGGFEPIIVRPWFGIRRGSHYAVAVVICGIVGVVTLLYLMQFLVGGWGEMFKSSGLLMYAAFGFGLISGGLCAELIYPIYIRIVPGRLDVFRYGFLGSGKPEVKAYDLRTIGLCVDFGSFSVALEPPRPPGEPLPDLITMKKWPNHKVFPEEYRPDYFTLALSPGRMEHCQRLIQAARTTEPTPDLPDDELIG